MKHGKWQVTMASGSIDMGHKMKCKRVNEILPVAWIYKMRQTYITRNGGK